MMRLFRAAYRSRCRIQCPTGQRSWIHHNAPALWKHNGSSDWDSEAAPPHNDLLSFYNQLTKSGSFRSRAKALGDSEDKRGTRNRGDGDLFDRREDREYPGARAYVRRADKTVLRGAKTYRAQKDKAYDHRYDGASHRGYSESRAQIWTEDGGEDGVRQARAERDSLIGLLDKASSFPMDDRIYDFTNRRPVTRLLLRVQQ